MTATCKFSAITLFAISTGIAKNPDVKEYQLEEFFGKINKDKIEEINKKAKNPISLSMIILKNILKNMKIL